MKQNNSPVFLRDAFDCPHCGCYSQQKWFQNSEEMMVYLQKFIPANLYPIDLHKTFLPNTIKISQCFIVKCGEYAIWYRHKMVYPRNASFIPDAPENLPDDLKKYYEEAKLIASDSPRSALILIRFILEKFLQKIYSNNKKISVNLKKIKDEKLKKAINSIRIIGNKATHCELNEIFEDNTKDFVLRDLELICIVLGSAVDELVTKHKKYDQINEVENKYDEFSKLEKTQK